MTKLLNYWRVILLFNNLINTLNKTATYPQSINTLREKDNPIKLFNKRLNKRVQCILYKEKALI